MLTLVETKDAVPLVGIYEVPDKKPGSKVLDKRQAANKKQVGTVYFTHEMDHDKERIRGGGRARAAQGAPKEADAHLEPRV